MINIDSPSQCSGCTACASVCGHKAIEMVPDVLGFRYPHVDPDKCVDCGLCDRVCPFNDDYDTAGNFDEPKAIGARLKDEELLAMSQSGGAFVALSDVVLANGGVVYGVGFDDDLRAVHKRVTTRAERDALRGSKYVQSELNDTLISVRNDLISGLTVMFTGTPCQTAGVHAFVPPRLRANLILVDLVCHGVPSPAVWSEYLEWIESKHKDKISSAIFRNKKKFTWHRSKETYRFLHKPEIDMTSFSYLFYARVCQRESCFECKFCNTRRPSDLTIGDFWGVEKVNPQLASDEKGVSLILINSAKGDELFRKAEKKMTTFTSRIEDVLQPNLREPSERPMNRTAFETDFAGRGVYYVMKKYGQDGLAFKTKKTVRRMLRLPIGVLRRVKKLLIPEK